MRSYSPIILVALFRFCLSQGTQDVENCTCGFYDANLDTVYTDSSIVYFNETDVLPDDFVIESFEHRYDRGWNNIYRQGASKDNVGIGNDTTARNLSSLQLYCNPSDDEHLVVGASVRTRRQDLYFGSFRSSMRAPRQWLHGSALTMLLDHNQTERWDVDIMNTDNSSQAWVSTLAKGEFSNIWLGSNFSALINVGMDPWFYTEYRVDWTRDRIDYYIGGELQRSFTKEINGTLPSTPAPLRFQHWSSGNKYNTQGPPGYRSEANIGWTRLFFNSSVTTDEQRREFDAGCLAVDACRIDDYSLRGSTIYPEEAAQEWKQTHPKRKTPWVPVIIDVVMASAFTVLLVKTVSRRCFWGKILIQQLPFGSRKLFSSITSLTHVDTASMTRVDFGLDSEGVPSSDESSRPEYVVGKTQFTSGPPSFVSQLPINSSYTSFEGLPNYPGTQTPAPAYPSPSMSRLPSRINSADDLTIEPIVEAHSEEMEIPGTSVFASNRSLVPSRNATMSRNMTKFYREGTSTSNPFLPRLDSEPGTPAPEAIPPAPTTPSASTPAVQSPPVHDVPVMWSQVDYLPTEKKPEPITIDKKGEAAPTAAVETMQPEAIATPAAGAHGKPTPVKRVDYLAGFIGISAVLVTLNHFCQTFFAAVIQPEVDPHYQSELWARKTIGAYIMDPLGIGPFLMISTRFLVSNYLRTGKLDNMAQKIVMRPFRLLTPVASIALLQYFLMDTGAVDWLEYLPSITWSSWPFTTIAPNPGVFLSEIIQLAYLIPNAAPMITYNYCTGVLWTIPVQLQGAWQTLIGLIMIKEIKTPWKRFSFYAFCIINHWYALSWGSYYYCGLLLADLDLNFKYTKYLHSHKLIYWPLLLLMSTLALGGFTIDLVTEWNGVQYATLENGWHPDAATGLSISQATHSTQPYPDYFYPRLNALIATVAMQTVVEICPTIQKILSAKILQALFPHIFTIYLIHGFVFWSVGSAAMIASSAARLPYWLCVLLVALCCYAVLFAACPLLTPPIEFVGKGFTQALWEQASQEPLPRRPTTFPFGRELLQRDVSLGASVGKAAELGEGPRCSVEADVVRTAIEVELDMATSEAGAGERVSVKQF